MKTSHTKKAAILTSYQHEYVKSSFYFPSEQHLKKIFADHDIELHYVSPYYFNQSLWEFSEHVIIWSDEMEIIQEPYKPDILWVRTWQTLYHLDEMLRDASFCTVPSMRLKHIESDKYQVYKYLQEFQPKTTLLTTYYFYPWLQEQFAENIVVKPVSWTWWYGVEFFTKDELCSNEVFTKYSWAESMHIVQDYKNFSDWCPWLVEWNHDVRLVFAWDKAMINYIRVPKSWSLKSNIASGGRQFSVPQKKIPQELYDMSKAIQQKLWVNQNDLYSLDYAYCLDEKRRYLIEINSAPWIWFPDEDLEYRDEFYNNVATHFSSLVKPL